MSFQSRGRFVTPLHIYHASQSRAKVTKAIAHQQLVKEQRRSPRLTISRRKPDNVILLAKQEYCCEPSDHVQCLPGWSNILQREESWVDGDTKTHLSSYLQ